MSSSSVCQGLQSCIEPRSLESSVLRLILAPPGSFSQEKTNTTPPPPSTSPERDMKMDKKAHMGGLSFLQSLSETCHYNKTEESEAENVYVHPAVKLSSSILSGKSLEMCTESLGCETGSNASESSYDIALFSLESSSSFTKHTPERASRNSVSIRVNRAGSFPPPLTSITDLGGIQVRPHREDGRLILKAVVTPSPQPYFRAERSSGRLRLRPFHTLASDCEDDDEVADDDDGIVDEEESDDNEEAETEAETHIEEACGEEDTEAEQVCCDEESEENNDNADDEMGKRKFARPRRCKESGNRNKGLANWEPFWVAT